MVESVEAAATSFSVWRMLRTLGVSLLVGVLVIRVFGCAERLAFMPSREAPVTPPGVEELWLTTSDGLRLHAWFIRARDAVEGEPRPAVLHLHGNAGNMSDHIGFSEFLADRGVHVMMLDYRGYGKSDTGRLRRDTVLLDAHAGLDAIVARSDVSRVGVYGVSLGGAFALKLAGDRPEVDRVGTLATFSTWRGVANDLLPVVGPVLLPGGWDPVDGVRKLEDRPLLLVHGTSDEVLHVRHLSVLRDAAVESGVDVRTVIVPGGRHNTTLFDSAEAERAIGDFFSEMSGGEARDAPPIEGLPGSE